MVSTWKMFGECIISFFEVTTAACFLLAAYEYLSDTFKGHIN